MRSDKGLLLVISGPSGVGKGAICKALINRNANMHFSVSATTRRKRADEAEGVNYFFKKREEFERMIGQGEFLEYMLLFNVNYYGTPRAYVEEELLAGNDILLEIDYQGAVRVKKAYPEAVLVFIAPPDMGELQSRLLHIGSGIDQLEERMSTAKDELAAAAHYDYIVVNDIVDRAVAEVERIVAAEKCAVARNRGLIARLITEN